MNGDSNEISAQERAQIEHARQEIAAGTFRPDEDAGAEHSVTDRARGIRLIDPTDRFIFTHSPNGDIHMMDTKPVTGSPPRAAALETSPHAFKPSAPSGGNITITSGYVNSLPVTGADGSTTWSVGTAEKYWVATTTNSSGIATSATVARGSSVPSDTATLGHQILFEVDATGKVTAQHVVTSLRHQRCGGSVHLFGGLG